MLDAIRNRVSDGVREARTGLETTSSEHEEKASEASDDTALSTASAVDQFNTNLRLDHTSM